VRVVKPGRPSEDYLLRKLIYCERCGARMHGSKGSSPPVRRYLCSTRRHGEGCDEPLAHAVPLEERIVGWLRDFQLDAELRAVVLASLKAAAGRESDDSSRRRERDGQLERLRDLYVMGDLSEDEYTLRRQALEEELERSGTPLDPELERAEAVLRDFSRFWEAEPKPAERRKLIASLFDRVWQDEGQIVAVKPREPFRRYFETAENLGGTRDTEAGVNSGSDGTRTRDLRRDRPAL
jgi:hypothetical protein